MKWLHIIYRKYTWQVKYDECRLLHIFIFIVCVCVCTVRLTDVMHIGSFIFVVNSPHLTNNCFVFDLFGNSSKKNLWSSTRYKRKLEIAVQSRTERIHQRAKHSIISKKQQAEMDRTCDVNTRWRTFSTIKTLSAWSFNVRR